jgi:hypothetical protein
MSKRREGMSETLKFTGERGGAEFVIQCKGSYYLNILYL